MLLRKQLFIFVLLYTYFLTNLHVGISLAAKLQPKPLNDVLTGLHHHNHLWHTDVQAATYSWLHIWQHWIMFFYTQQSVERLRIMPTVNKRWKKRQEEGMTVFLKTYHRDSKLASATQNTAHLANTSTKLTASSQLLQEHEIYWSHDTWELLQQHDNPQCQAHVSEKLHIYKW